MTPRRRRPLVPPPTAVPTPPPARDAPLTPPPAQPLPPARDTTPRRALLAAPLLLAAAPAAPPPALYPADWAAFRARFLAPEGRILDTGNANQSHTEGQGWALLLAEATGDRAGFDRILGWTERTLRRRADALFAWRYRPGPGVDDPNNATDGDLYIAWALARAARRWRAEPYARKAAAIGRDILRLLTREAAGQTVLLPGLAGFEAEESVTLNPSYYVFPAFAALAALAPDPRWQALAADGRALLRRARFGAYGLPPDWLTLPRDGGPPAIAAAWPPRFSFDAVRVPLLLAWGGFAADPAVSATLAFWGDPRFPEPPAWVDLATGATAGFASSPGVRAIAALARAAGGAPVALPQVVITDYYSTALMLLARMAAQDLGLGLFPPR